MALILSHTVALLVVAIFVAIVARRVRLPYTVGLVLTGIGLALARVETETTLTHDFILMSFSLRCCSRRRCRCIGPSFDATLSPC